jgi:hypothetical protein
MAEEQGAMTAEIVDVLVTVDVPFAGAARACGIDRIGQKRAGIMRQARRDHLAGLLVEFR